MKINSYKKLKNGQYKIILEDKEILLHEDLILKNNLLITKELTSNQIRKLEEENTKYLIYDEALKYLKTKIRSKKEMYEYLKKKEYDNSNIYDVIKMLEKQKYLNDEVYAQAFINDRIHLSNDGPYKIKKALVENGIKKEVIDKYVGIYDESLQRERIEKLIQKRIKTNHTKSKSILKRKIMMDLNNLGYTTNLIRNALSLLDDVSDEEIRKREYEKLYVKLSKKYTGYELEAKIKQKMYQKGFY